MSPVPNVLRQLAIDWRLVLMGAVLVATAIVFNILSGGLFLSPENLYNIAQQTAVVGIVASGMALIIVSGIAATALRARILRKFKNPIVVPAACGVEPGLIGAAILGLDFAREHQGG